MVGETMTPVAKTNGTLQRWDPFGLFDTLQQEFEHFLHRPYFWSSVPWPVIFPPFTTGKMTFAPRTDVYEKDGMLVFKAEMPGLTKEDVQVEVADGDLVIKGESKAEKETKDAAYYRMERTYGGFYRRLPLPFEVKPEQITASLTDGVLEVQIRKPVSTKLEATKIPVA